MKRDNEEIIKRMTECDIRVTGLRLLIVSVIEKADHPVSSAEIETILDTVDRSTISRALSLFVSKHLIHVIEDGSGSSKYEYCRSPHSHSVSDLHAHFHCRRCGSTFCLTDVEIPNVTLPKGYRVDSANFVVTGLCDACAKVSPED